MGTAPIPPHERSWRHPSELAPTAPAHTDDHGHTSRWALAAAGGAVAIAVVGVFALTTAPQRASGPVAMSATTMPAYTVASVAGATSSTDDSSADSLGEPSAEASFGSVRLEQPMLSTSAGLALTGAPKTIAAPVPNDDAAATTPSSSDTDTEAETDTDTEAGAPNAIVRIITESHVYVLSWSDLERVMAPDGSIVVDDEGRLVGSFLDGEFVDS